VNGSDPTGLSDYPGEPVFGIGPIDGEEPGLVDGLGPVADESLEVVAVYPDGDWQEVYDFNTQKFVVFPDGDGVENAQLVNEEDAIRSCPAAKEAELSGVPENVPTADAGPTESISDILQPGGNPIGKAGTDETIRELPGGLSEAQAMFDRLSQGATVVEQTPYLTRVELSDGGFVQLRTVMSRSPGTAATIDVNIPGIDITKLKYNP
jgi:hypothetical protein